MKKFLMLVFAAVLAVSAVCFAEAPKAAEGTQTVQTQAAAAYKTLTPQQAKQRMEPQQAKQRMEQNDKIVVLDVRTQEEFAAGHIPGAVLLPVDLIEAKSEEVAKVLPDKDAEILVYCRSGKRAHRASQALADMGYTNIEHIGGIMDWPYEIVK